MIELGSARFTHLPVTVSPTAVDNGQKEIVELLVRNGAEVNGTHTASCWTCLHEAVYEVTSAQSEY